MPRKRKNQIRMYTRSARWYVSWYDPILRRTCQTALGTTDRKTADAVLPLKIEELGIRNQIFGVALPSAPAPKVEGPLTVRQALDDYDSEHVKDSGEVADQARQRIALRHLKAHFGNTPLRDVDIPACRGYRDARRRGIGSHDVQAYWLGRKARDSTVRRELAALKAAANHAQKWRRIAAAEMPSIELPKADRRPRQREFFSHHDLATLIFEAPNSDLRDLILLWYYWGARRKSVERMHMEQVNLAHGFANLARIDELTTSKRRPIVPIFRPIRAILERRVSTAHERQGFLFSRGADFYWPFREYCEALGIQPTNPHALRHSRITHMLMAGVSIYKVAKLVGDTVPVIERYYGHFSPDFLDEV